MSNLNRDNLGKSFAAPEQREGEHMCAIHPQEKDSQNFGSQANRLPRGFTHCMPCLWPEQPWLGRNSTLEVLWSWNSEGLSPLRGEGWEAQCWQLKLNEEALWKSIKPLWEQQENDLNSLHRHKMCSGRWFLLHLRQIKDNTLEWRQRKCEGVGRTEERKILTLNSEEKTIREPHPQWMNIPGLSFLSSLAIEWLPAKQGNAQRVLYLYLSTQTHTNTSVHVHLVTQQFPTSRFFTHL